MDAPAQAPATFNSKWEQYFYTAMVAAKRRFEYQKPFWGGHFARGGTVVDFVDTSPGQLRPIAIYIDGPYWHHMRNTGKALEDKLKRARLDRMGYNVKVVTTEAETPEGCRKWIKENL